MTKGASLVSVHNQNNPFHGLLFYFRMIACNFLESVTRSCNWPFIDIFPPKPVFSTALVTYKICRQKGKDSPLHAMTSRGEMEVLCHSVLTSTLPEGAWRGERLPIAACHRGHIAYGPQKLKRLEKRKMSTYNRNRTSGCPALDLANLVTALSWLSNVCCMAQKTNVLTVIFSSLLLALSPLDPDSLHSSLFSYVTHVFFRYCKRQIFTPMRQKKYKIRGLYFNDWVEGSTREGNSKLNCII